MGLPLASRWKAYGGIYGTPTFTVAQGICSVEGLIKHRSWGGLASLPANCRPNKRLIFNLNNHAKTSHVDVLAGGQILWVTGGRDHSWRSLSGIIFSASAGRSALPLVGAWKGYGGSYSSPTFTVVDDLVRMKA